MYNRTKSTESPTLGSPPRTLNHDTARCWTDDLPVCHLSAVGTATNQIYREDGKRQEDHAFEDQSFHFKSDDIYLYGVFDGHNGSNASNFAAQRLPAELLFGQLDGVVHCEDIKDILIQAFSAVEKSFFEQMDKILAERATLLQHMTEPQALLEPSSDIAQKLQVLEREIAGGTTALIALILHNKLYIANVGDTRALLVTMGENGVLKVSQLSTDHTISNENEMDRLHTLGLDVELLRQQRRIGTSDNTRCIGDYHVKGGRGDIPSLSDAASDPVIAEPDVVGGIPIDESCLFLVLMSDGLYHALQDATGLESVNTEIARMVFEEFATQSTLSGVAQAVVDKVVRKHNDKYLLSLSEKIQTLQKCGDITILVRQFNCPFPNALLSSPTGGAMLYPVSVPFHQARSTNHPSLIIPDLGVKLNELQEQETPVAVSVPSPDTPINMTNQTLFTNQTLVTANTDLSTSSESMQCSGTRLFSSKRHQNKLEVDADGKVTAYVDFSGFYNALNAMNENDRNQLLQSLMPVIEMEPISEVSTENADATAESSVS